MEETRTLLTELPVSYIRDRDIISKETGKKKAQISKEAFSLYLYGIDLRKGE